MTEPASRPDPASDPGADPAPLEAHRAGDLPVHLEEMPVVARMVIEVRSDGVRTMARGALEDLRQGEQVAIELPAMTPAQLSAALAGTLGKLLTGSPGLARAALRSVVPDRVRRLKHRLFGSSDD